MKTGDFYMVIHPEIQKLIHLTAKEKWQMKYRAQRMAKKGRFEPLMRGELGTIQGFRFAENTND